MMNQRAGFSKDCWLFCWNCLHVHSPRGFHRAGDQSLRRQLKNGGEEGGGHVGWWRVKACGLRIRQQEARLRQGYRAVRCDDPTDVSPTCSSEPLLRVRIIFSLRWRLTKARLMFTCPAVIMHGCTCTDSHSWLTIIKALWRRDRKYAFRCTRLILEHR